MKIKNITTEVIHIPLKTPFITALRRVENIEFVRVKLECINGFIAYGEAPATMAITGEDIPIILNSISLIKNDLLNIDLISALEILHNSSIGSSAKASLDMAIITLLAKEKNIPLYKYFIKKDENLEVKTLFTDVTISLNTIEKMFKDAKDAISQNMPILKIKLGHDILHAIKVTKLLANKLKESTLLIDANQAWSLESSLEYLESVKDLKIELIEQPVEALKLEDLKQITQKSHINIMADEAVFTLEDAKQIIKSKSADMINIKLMKCGGLSKAVEILEFAREKGVKCMLGSMLEGPISINAALHLALAYGDVIKYIDLDSPLLYKEPSNELCFEFNGSEIKLKTLV
jgi:L-alanine-DL-glutamate epimerase-like enolase superfamily enzyme